MELGFLILQIGSRSDSYRHFSWRRSLDNDLVDIVENGNLTYDRSWFVEIQLRGLGGTGKQLDNLFDNNIDGYTDWQAKRQ